MQHTVFGMLSAATLIGVASLVGKRWGAGLSGWFVALPLISGPIVFTLALERGPAFARLLCVGSMLALLSLCAFALAYAWVARRAGWAASAVLACAVFVACTWGLQLLPAPPIGWAFALGCVVLAATLYLLPVGAPGAASAPMPPWDIPLRMFLAAALVLALSSASTYFGPRVSGLLTPFPITSTILVSFTRHNEGEPATRQFLRGLLKGLFSFAVFLLVVALTIGSLSMAATFTTATVVTLVFHTGAWRWVQRTPVSRGLPRVSEARE